MSNRKKISKEVERQILVSCRRRCCICFGLERDQRVKNGQIAHIDQDPSNNSQDNLAFLCLEHHDQYDGKTRQSKGITEAEVKTFRSELHAFFSSWIESESIPQRDNSKYIGYYERKSSTTEAHFVITRTGALVQVRGLSYWGINRLNGPNLGELDFVSAVVDGEVRFVDEHASPPYSLKIKFFDGGLSVEEKMSPGYFGMNVNFGGSFTQVRDWQEKPPDSVVNAQSFGLNYMRLFGALETSLLLKLLEHEGKLEMTPTEVDSFYTMADDEPWVREDLVKFWKNEWEYKNSLPIKTDLWISLAGNRSFAKDLYWTALSPGLCDLLEYAKNSDVDQVGDLPQRLFEAHNFNISSEDVYKMEGTKSSDIGFLFLILTNNTVVEMFDVEMNFIEFLNPLVILHGGNFVDNLTKKDPKEIALRPDNADGAKGEYKRLRMASLKPGRSIIWILSAYRKDASGLPSFYLTNPLKPTLFRYKSNGTTQTEVIRSPFGLEAARVNVPSGWFHQ